MADQFYDHIVIGAGISGLAAAYHSGRKQLKTLVLEASDRIGGCIHSHHFHDEESMWVETGGHSCYNSYGNLLRIINQLGMRDEILAKEKCGYQLYANGTHFPIRKRLSVLDAIVHLPSLMFAKKAGASVRDYFSRFIGKRNYRNLMQYAFRAVLCQPADNFPADMMFRKKPRDKTIPRQFTLPQGLSSIIERLVASDCFTVQTDCNVIAIEPETDGFLVITQQGTYHCRSLTLAVPPTVVTALLGEHFTQLRGIVRRIWMAELDTLAVLVNKKDLILPKLAGLIGIEQEMYSLVTRDYLSNDHYRAFSFHFAPNALSTELQLRHAARVLSITTTQIKEHFSVRHRLPALQTGHDELVRQIDTYLKGTRLALTGNWFIGLSIEDSLTRCRSEMIRLFGE